MRPHCSQTRCVCGVLPQPAQAAFWECCLYVSPSRCTRVAGAGEKCRGEWGKNPEWGRGRILAPILSTVFSLSQTTPILAPLPVPNTGTKCSGSPTALLQPSSMAWRLVLQDPPPHSRGLRAQRIFTSLEEEPQQRLPDENTREATAHCLSRYVQPHRSSITELTRAAVNKSIAPNLRREGRMKAPCSRDGGGETCFTDLAPSLASWHCCGRVEVRGCGRGQLRCP